MKPSIIQLNVYEDGSFYSMKEEVGFDVCSKEARRYLYILRGFAKYHIPRGRKEVREYSFERGRIYF
jgi:hypothetical protein